MMISPDGFLMMHEFKTYAELLLVRDDLIREIQDFEKHPRDPEEVIMHPSPEVRYQCNLLYLSKISELIMEKHNQEYIRGDNGNSEK